MNPEQEGSVTTKILEVRPTNSAGSAKGGGLLISALKHFPQTVESQVEEANDVSQAITKPPKRKAH
jgi:hypothetical protein